MADYTKLRVGVLYSENSDYSRPRLQSDIDAYVPTTATEYQQALLTIGTTSETLDLSGFTTILYLVIKNQDSTNFIEFKHRYTKASTAFAANKLGFTATAPCTITDDDSTFVSGLRFKKGDYAVVSSATEAANNGTFLVQAAAAGTLTLEETAALTLDADDAGTPTIKSVTELEGKVLPGGIVVFNDVRPDDDLILLANTASCDCEILIVGL